MMPGWANVLEQKLYKTLPFLKRLPKWAWGIILLGVMLAATLFTDATNGPESSVAPSTSIETLGTAIGVILKLGIVLALIYGSLLLLRRWRFLSGNAKIRQLQVLETTRLTQKQALHLVRVGERVILIGATDQNLTLLSEIVPEPNDLLGSSLEENNQSLSTGLTFNDLLVEKHNQGRI
jgi:flagellar biosynthetic protein FliO